MNWADERFLFQHDGKVAEDVYDKMVNSSIDGNGYLNFQSWDDLGLVFSLDEESQLVIQYGEEKEQ